MIEQNERVQAAKNRLATDHYMEWVHAGGPNPCSHGYALGIPCRRCDEELVSADIVPRFSIEFHRGVYFSTPSLGTCEVVKASDYDASVAKRFRRDREIIDMIDKTQSCTSGMSHSDCLEWVKKKLGESGSALESGTHACRNLCSCEAFKSNHCHYCKFNMEPV